MNSAFVTATTALLVLLYIAVVFGLEVWSLDPDRQISSCFSGAVFRQVRCRGHLKSLTRRDATVRQKLPPGRRLLKIDYLRDVVNEIKEMIQQEIEKKDEYNYANKRTFRKTKLVKLMSENINRPFGSSSYQDSMAKSGELARWLPDVISINGIWEEPLEAQNLVRLFETFTSDVEEQVEPTVSAAFRSALLHAQLREISELLQALATANVPFTKPYEAVGEHAARRCASCAREDLEVFGWALASMKESVTHENCAEALKMGMAKHMSKIPSDHIRLIAWSCAEAGEQIPDLFGFPPFDVYEIDAQQTWSSCSQLAALESGRLLAGFPLPVITVDQAVAPDVTASLVTLANDKNLWRPSARQGVSSGNQGDAVGGRPWTALLASPDLQTHPAVVALRQWTAMAFTVSLQQVEDVRLVRYRQGEVPAGEHPDARPPSDPSLWLRGQRMAAVMFSLNDLPAGSGGETHFSRVGFEGEGGLKVPALSAGSALVWPTVRADGFPEEKAARCALPVLSDDVKYVAMTWVRAEVPP